MKSIAISQVDALFSTGSYPIEFLLYYPERLDTGRLRAALRRLADDFWPAFGRNGTGRIRFAAYREERHFREVVDSRRFDPRASTLEIHRAYADVNPAVDRELFYLTVLQHENGTVLLPKMNHLVGDGYSFFYLLGVFAVLTQAPHNPFKRYLLRRLAKPLHDRTRLRRFQFDQPIGEQRDAAARQRDAAARQRVDGSLESTIELVEIAKAEVEGMVERANGATLSANDVLTAMVLQRTAQAQAEVFGDELTLTTPMDVRRHLKSYGRRFFGNGLLFNRVRFDTDRARRADVLELATSIRRARPAIDRESYIAELAELERWLEDHRDELTPYDPDRGCLVTNISRLPVNRLDFGTGAPSYVLPLTVGRNSAAVMARDDRYVLRLVS